MGVSFIRNVPLIQNHFGSCTNMLLFYGGIMNEFSERCPLFKSFHHDSQSQIETVAVYSMSLSISGIRATFKRPGVYWAFWLSPSCSCCHVFSKAFQLAVLLLLYTGLAGRCRVCSPSPSALLLSALGRFPRRHQNSTTEKCFFS